ncbi:transporter substrate-binding domain-containing protein [Bradyrhizobium sp. DOA9]|uniref:transporter substrate-binding domain-containing protein n=1 Tax=Bradyrhizobium sp. DOA9 TaxID=1126627 RepID=UPI0009EF267F
MLVGALSFAFAAKIYNVARWGFKNEDGSVSGIHPDILRAVLAAMSINDADFAIVEFPALISSLVSKRTDVVATGMAITPVRCHRSSSPSRSCNWRPACGSPGQSEGDSQLHGHRE